MMSNSSGSISLLCGWWSPGTGCPEGRWSLPPWRSPKSSGQLALDVPTWAVGLDQMASKSPFLLRLFYDCMITLTSFSKNTLNSILCLILSLPFSRMVFRWSQYVNIYAIINIYMHERAHTFIFKMCMWMILKSLVVLHYEICNFSFL